MRIVDFKKPKNLDEVCFMTSELGEKAIIMSGGTSFQFLTEDTERVAIDVNSAIPKGINTDKSFFKIGATTTIADLQEYSAYGWVLNNVANKLSTQPIRNMSTLGGNVARIFPWSDFPVALLALDAQINVSDETEKKNIPKPIYSSKLEQKCQSSSEHSTSHNKNGLAYKAEAFFKQQPAHLLKNKTLITSIEVPIVPNGSGFGYHKEVRTSGGLSTLTVAAYLKYNKNIITDVKIAAGAALGLPVRLKAIEEALIEKSANNISFEEIVPVLIHNYPWKGKEGASNEYAQHLAETIIIDVLKESLLDAEGGTK
jgi:aerobic carbon-monoxide dehydrogenase medium subunit